MTIAVGLILISALLHAAWNAIFKALPDKQVGSAGLGLIGALIYLPLTFFTPLPDPNLWPYIAASWFFHVGYTFSLIAMLGMGEFTLVYPIARGTGPAVVMIGAIMLGADKITPPGIIGIALIIAGSVIASMSAVPSSKHRFPGLKTTWAAILTGGWIGLYTLIDGLGMKAATDPMSFMAWSLGPFAAFLFLLGLYQRRMALLHSFYQDWRLLLPMGIMSYGGFGIALYALMLGSLSEIAALRETSIVFAAIIGTVFLREHLSRNRVFGIFTILLGAVFLRF